MVSSERSTVEARQIVGIVQAMTTKAAIELIAEMLDDIKKAEAQSLDKIIKYHKAREQLACARLREVRDEKS